MLPRRLALLVLGVAACGARSELDDATSASSGVPTGARAAHVDEECAPNDAAAIRIVIDGTHTCPGTFTTGTSIFVWGKDLTSLGAGTSLMVGSGPGATTQASHYEGAQVVNALGGHVSFVEYDEGKSAAGVYDLSFSSTSAEGTFTASWCTNRPMCR
jgi:hypothetical protein